MENIQIIEMDESKDILLKSLKRTHELFIGNVGAKLEDDPELNKFKRTLKINDEYAPHKDTQVLVNDIQRQKILKTLGVAEPAKTEQKEEKKGAEPAKTEEEKKILAEEKKEAKNLSLVSILTNAEKPVMIRPRKEVKPEWHKPWKLMRVISGHQGWVRCLATDPMNQYFVSGSNDRTIKFWDLASGQLKITLTGHINTVRGLVVSNRHPYLFSCGEDKSVICWDLEQNKIVRKYHGHLSGVYCIAFHPLLDVIATGGRDSTARIWDIRTKSCVHTLGGHNDTIGSILTQGVEPQIITGSYDTTVKFWDLGTGKCMQTLTQHKKGIRAMVAHHDEYTFASAGADKVRVWKCPDGQPLRNIAGHNAIINSMSLNNDNVLVTAADNGTMYFWDWASGYNFQQMKSLPQPGSLSCESGIYASTFDQSSLRLITGECDKTIKLWKEDENATPETNPIQLANLKSIA